MSDFKAPNTISAEALRQTTLGELTALPQTSYLVRRGLAQSIE